MGRVIFRDYQFAWVQTDFLEEIPGGPDISEEFVYEGIRILEANPEFHLPALLVTPQDDAIWDKKYWVVDGRHRRRSYLNAERRIAPVIIGTGGVVLP